jgi:hypothetical protein
MALPVLVSNTTAVLAEGSLSKETPASVNDLKLIISGKFVENGKQLKGRRRSKYASSC